MWLSGGECAILVVLYSINVFITFALSQLGMVRHWWTAEKVDRPPSQETLHQWPRLVLCSTILVVMTCLKFWEGGWITIMLTAGSGHRLAA